MNRLDPPAGWLGPLLRSVAAKACFNGAYCLTCGPGQMPEAICELLGLPPPTGGRAFPAEASALLVSELRSLPGELLDDAMVASFASRLIADLAGRDAEGREAMRRSLGVCPAGRMLERGLRSAEESRARAAAKEGELEHAREARREGKASAHAERVAKGPERKAAWLARNANKAGEGEGER